jgi:tetraacyldisaccharide 4'-kinase
VAAFCGLANPAAFWETLDQLGTETAWRREFADHHRYTQTEIESLAMADAETLVTTEKDLANIPCRPSLPLYWLRIGLEVEGAEELLAMILR